MGLVKSLAGQPHRSSLIRLQRWGGVMGLRSAVLRAGAVGAVSAGLAVSLVVSAVPARALSGDGISIGAADRMFIRSIGGLVEAPTPGVMARAAKVCVKPTPGAAACMVGAVALLGTAVLTKDLWWPWLKNAAGEGFNKDGPSTVTVPCSSTSWEPAVPTSGVTIANFPAFKITQTGPGVNATPGNGTSCYSWFSVESSVKKPDGTVLTKSTPFNTQTYINNATQALNSASTSFWPQGAGSTDKVLEMKITALSQTATGVVGEGAVNGLWFKTSVSEEDLNVQTTVKCQRPDGTTYDVTRQGQPNLGYVKVGYCEPGDLVTGYRLTEGGIPRMDIDTKPDPGDVDRFPLCAGAACGYNVRLDNQPCVEGDGRCEDWAQTAQDAPARVTCWYGPYQLTIDQCYWLERAYGVQAYPLTGPNVDGDPATVDNPATSPTPSPTSTSTSTATASPTPGPAPTVTVTAAPTPGTCATPYALGPVQSQTAALVNNLAPRFGVTTVYGWRETDAFPDHPSGLAADFMTYTNTAKGDSLATYAIQNAPALAIDYVIWKQRIWSLDRAAEGWRVMADRGSLTANHYDHVHITTKQVSGSLACSGDPGDSDPNSSACWPTGWGAVFNPAGWVLQPIKCAFIPRPGHLNASVDGLITKVKAKGPGALIDQLGDVGAQLDNASGCAGPSVPFDVGDFHLDIQLLNACSGQMATVAGYVKAFLTVGISVGGVAGVVRGIGSGFGWSFSLGRGGGSGDV